jgi:hypothetical protein
VVVVVRLSGRWVAAVGEFVRLCRENWALRRHESREYDLLPGDILPRLRELEGGARVLPFTRGRPRG